MTFFLGLDQARHIERMANSALMLNPDYLARIDIHWSMGRAAAAFDTRLDWPRLLSGSAADQIANRLAALGAKMPRPRTLCRVFTRTQQPRAQRPALHERRAAEHPQ